MVGVVAAEGREDGIVLRDPAIFAPSNVEVAPTTANLCTILHQRRQHGIERYRLLLKLHCGMVQIVARRIRTFTCPCSACLSGYANANHGRT